MGRACSICTRPDAGAINVLLGDGRSARSVALALGVSEDALQRHAQRHVARLVPTVTDRAAKAPSATTPTADSLDELVDALRTQALAGNPAIVHQYRLALAAQADIRHAAPPTRDLATEPEWVALRTLLLRAVEPFAEVRLVLADALAAAGTDR